MIVTIEYGDEERTGPLESVTGLDRDDDRNLVVTFNDGTRSTFVNGSVKTASESPDTRTVHS